MTIRALIFDFDGLILDTETTEYASWREVYQAHGCALSLPSWTNSIGLGANAIRFDPYTDLEARHGRSCPACATTWRTPGVSPSTTPTCASLSNLSLADLLGKIEARAAG